MFEAKQVGPFVVNPINVSEGLELMMMANDESKAFEFQKKLLLACITKDGKRIDNLAFGEFMPHINELLSAALEVNGFRNEQTGSDNPPDLLGG